MDFNSLFHTVCLFLILENIYSLSRPIIHEVTFICPYISFTQSSGLLFQVKSRIHNNFTDLFLISLASGFERGSFFPCENQSFIACNEAAPGKNLVDTLRKESITISVDWGENHVVQPPVSDRLGCIEGLVWVQRWGPTARLYRAEPAPTGACVPHQLYANREWGKRNISFIYVIGLEQIIHTGMHR